MLPNTYNYARGDTIMVTRRRFITASAAGFATGLTGFAPPAGAQTIQKTVRIIVGFPPGGATDVVARFIAEKLRGKYAETIIVDNRPGGGSRTAIEHAKKGDSDGTAILLTPSFPMVIYPHTYKKLAYDPLHDFTLATVCGVTAISLVAGPGLPASVKTVAEYTQWVKSNPKQAKYAAIAAGSSPHFVGVMIAKATGLDLTPVHYKGGSQQMQDILGGQIPVGINPIAEVLPHTKAGKLRVLATTGTKRSKFFPDVPTMQESGYKDVVAHEWFGLYVPSKTSPEIVAKLNAALGEILKTEEMAENLAKFGTEVTFTSLADSATFLKSEYERWQPVVKASGFTAED
jgi:tripartite-type tricarboxylate transporter receptor subunit TctC